MAKLPIDTRLKTEQMIEDKMVVQDLRPYLGMSSIADPCPRKLWYGFRLCKTDKTISARVNRLFQRGHNEEPIIQIDLRSIGIKHHSDQLEVVDGNGHIGGHIDDILEGVPDATKTPHLGEYKTHNDKSFKDLLKKGMRKSKPVHAGQMDCYMYKLKLKRGLYIAVNKNDDTRYYERIAVDKENAKALISRGIDIISSEIPPQKPFASTWYACKWCDYYQVCHFGEPVSINCRTCDFCDILDEGKWSCSVYDVEINFERQKLGCGKHKLMEVLKGA